MKTTIQLVILITTLTITSSCATRQPAHKKVTIIKVAPKGHKIVHVNGKRYYKWNNTHYRKTRNGYVIVR
ncbi:MAG: hypothetical protein ACPGU9_04300 [Flavobacteriaceae bacterium]